jgi:hypothetical protein
VSAGAEQHPSALLAHKACRSMLPSVRADEQNNTEKSKKQEEFARYGRDPSTPQSIVQRVSPTAAPLHIDLRNVRCSLWHVHLVGK